MHRKCIQAPAVAPECPVKQQEPAHNTGQPVFTDRIVDTVDHHHHPRYALKSSNLLSPGNWLVHGMHYYRRRRRFPMYK